MNKWLRTIALALLVFVAFPALGQELFVDIDASTNTPGLNESFTLTYTLKMKRNNGSVSFQHRGIDVSRPPFEGFSKIDEGVGNPSFTFGGFDQDMDLYIYQVVLKPLEKGKFKIPPVSFIVNDTKISSKEFEIHVGNKVNIPKKAGDADLFVSIDLSKTEVYVGEPVTAVYKIYLKKGNIVETEALEFPQYSGFWVESYEQETQWQNKVINGVRYQYIEVKRDVLFPQRAGEFELEDFLFAGLVKYRVQSNSFFPQYKTERLSDKSGKKKIRVKPLPTGQPDNFMGSLVPV